MNRNKILFLSLLIAVIAIFFFVFKKPSQITNYSPSGKTIVAFGDSLTQGVGATEGNDFPSALSKLIGEPIINMGVSGNTSAQGLLRIEDVNKEDPKVVLVLFHPNDAGYKKIAEKIYPILKKGLQ